MLEHVNYRLGRGAVRHSPVRRLAAHDLMALLPPPPSSVDNTDGVLDWGMMANDVLGDCTCAGIGHSLQVATVNTGAILTATDAQVEDLYKRACGWVPGNPGTDQGGIEPDVLAYVQKNGFAGARLLGWVSPDPKNLDHVRQAIAQFGSVYVGAELPLSAQHAGLWRVVPGREGVAGGWGGHCMVAAAYSPSGPPFITWGKNQPAGWDWWNAYVDECHVPLWDVWLKRFPTGTQASILGLLGAVEN